MGAKAKTPREKANTAAPTESAREKPIANKSINSAVETFLHELKHPLKPVIELIRQLILGVSAKIHEGIKWNAPSFCTSEHFATFNLARANDRVMLILHTGAKPRKLKLKRLIADPADLLKWLADDRCMVTFDSVQEVEAKQSALEAIIREWIRHV